MRTYSSGMVVRLAFAVAAHVDPDILIVDEALSVGDARFQLKCARAIDRFIEQGVTLLFVSHDTTTVKRLCNRAILLERGQLVFHGHPNDVTNLYSKLVAEGGSLESIQDDIAALNETAKKIQAPEPVARTSGAPSLSDKVALVAPSEASSGGTELEQVRLLNKALLASLREKDLDGSMGRRVEALLQDERAHVQVSGQEFSYGGDLGSIAEVLVTDEKGDRRTWFDSGEQVRVLMDIEAREDLPAPIYALTIKNTAGVEVYGTNTLFGLQPAGALRSGERRRVVFSFPINLMPGFYFLSFGFTHFVGEELVIVHRRYDAVKLEVFGRDKTFGIANLHARIEVAAFPTA